MLYSQSLAHKSFQSLPQEKLPSWLLGLSTAMKPPCSNSHKTLLSVSKKDFPPQKYTYLETNPSCTPPKTVRLTRGMPIKRGVTSRMDL